MERAATGTAAGEVRGALEHRPAPGDDEDLNAARDRLRELVPGADIWFVRGWGGHVSWVLQLTAGSPEHLLDALADAARDAGAAP